MWRENLYRQQFPPFLFYKWRDNLNDMRRRRFSEALALAWKEKYERGLTVLEISIETKIPPSTVKGWLQRVGVQMRPKGARPHATTPSDEMYLCHGCWNVLPRSAYHEGAKGRPRPVKSRCRDCTKWPEKGKACILCQRVRRLDGDKCLSCIAKEGWKKCRDCGHLRLIDLEIYRGRARCLACQSSAP